MPGRLQIVDHDPLTLYDGAHNPSGIAALAGALPDHDLIAVVSILDDKDAAAMLRTLLPRCAGAVFTASANRRSLSPATLASLAGQLGGPPAEIEPDPRRAVARARALAGPDGAVVATGSIYLVADLLARRARGGRARCERARAQCHRDDRARGGGRGGRHPRVLRRSDMRWAGFPMKDPSY